MLRSSILLAATLLVTAAQADEQCALRQLASFDLKRLSDGALSIPITIAGKQQIVALDISDPFSYLYADYGDAEKFKTRKIPSGIAININKQISKDLYSVPELAIGNAGGNDIQFVRVEGPHRFGEESVGELALDLLSNFDVELDLKNGKLKLFSQDHCPGKVVYWATSYAVVPFIADKSGHTVFDMTLDGKSINVSFDLSPSQGRMGMKTANRVFGIEENSFGLEKVTGRPPDAPVVYTYPFKSLSVDGVTIINPGIHLVPQIAECRSRLAPNMDSTTHRCFGGSDLTIGQTELRELHLYFAFKEKMLYVTAADAHN